MGHKPGTPQLLREINDRSVLDLMVRSRSVTRAQLVGATGLSKPTATQLLNRLEAAGLISHAGTTAGRTGRAAQVYELNPHAGYVLALDVATDHIAAAVTDITGTVRAQHAAEADLEHSADPITAVMSAISAVVDGAGLPSQGLGQLVIASPGVYDPGLDLIKHAEHMAGWAGSGVASQVGRRLDLAASIENDVNVVAVAERAQGAAVEVDSFALLWVGAGLGLAIDLAGRVHRGASGGAGEIGYMPLPGFAEADPAGCPDFQSLVDEDALLKLARRHGLPTGTCEEAVRAAASGSSEGTAFLTTLADRLATGLAMVVSVLDPELVVLAGPISLAGGEELRALVQQRLRALIPLRPRLALSAIPGNPVLVGATEVGLARLRDSLFSSTVSNRNQARPPGRSATSAQREEQ